MPRWLLLLVAWLALVQLPARPARAFGATDAFGTGFASLSDSQRREVAARVVPLLKQAGVTHLRLAFGLNDVAFGWGDIAAHLDQPRLYTLDALIADLLEAGIEPEIVLSVRNDADHGANTLLPKDATAWKQFVKLVVERYDGDVDFGVNGCDTELGGPYPDIDASGKCGYYDFHTAPDSKRQAWADRHLVHTYTLEDAPFELVAAHAIPPEQYGQLVVLTVPWMRGLVPEGFGLRVVMGGVRFAPENRLAFVQALGAVASADPSVRPDAAEVFALVDEGAWLTGEPYEDVVHGAKSFGDWLASAGLKDLPFQVGRVSSSAGKTATFPWQPGPGQKGTCHGRFCSERGQVESLVRGLVRMGWRHPAPAYVSNVIEFVGAGEADDAWAWHGLYVERGDSAVTALQIDPRPAATVLAWLDAQVPQALTGPLTEVFPLPANTHAFRVDDASVPTWIAWYDWQREVPDGSDYLGITKNLEIVDVDSPAVRVTPLLPGLPGAPLEPGAPRAVTGGTLALELAQEVLLIQATDEPVADQAEAVDVVEASDASGDAVVPDTVGEDDGGGGCRAAGSPARGAWIVLALGLLGVRSRSRRPAAR